MREVNGEGPDVSRAIRDVWEERIGEKRVIKEGVSVVR